MLCAIKHDNSKKGTETENCWAAGVSTGVLDAVTSAEFLPAEAERVYL